jgi:3-phosphoglycerate kinase
LKSNLAYSHPYRTYHMHFLVILLFHFYRIDFCYLDIIRVLVRCDLNVPLSKEGVITDDTRIRGSIPTIKYLSDKGAKVLLTSHLGRPKGGFEKKFSLAPVAPRLAELLKRSEVKLVPDCIGKTFFHPLFSVLQTC